MKKGRCTEQQIVSALKKQEAGHLHFLADKT